LARRVSAAAGQRLVLTERDRQLIRGAWSLGFAPASTLRALISPTTSAGTFRDRLRRLHRAGHLLQTRYVAPAGDLWLYGVGRAALTAGEPAPWRPSLAQVEHTLAVGQAVVALTRPGFAPPLHITGWQGESELRAWAAPGAPYPDARISWTRDQTPGSWLVEVDRATESRAAWRRKLVRYLTANHSDPVLVLTTSRRRANGLAVVAADLGVPLLATTLTAACEQDDPPVLDARRRSRLPLSTASAADSTG
jgi:hypothetical protein